MYRKIIGAALVAAFTTVAANADVVMDATPGNDNGANLTSDGSLTNTAGQTFTTGTLTSNELVSIEIDGPLSAGGATEYYVAVYNDVDQDAGTWDLGALVGVSTNTASMDTGTSLNSWGFNLPVLSNSTVYAFTFTTDAGGTTTPTPNVRPGMRGNTDPYPSGTVFGGGSPQFGGNYDIAAKIITGTDPVASIIEFIASETVVAEGDPVTLSWITENADTLILNPGGTDVTTVTSTVVVVNSTTTYELIASNTSGSVVTNSLTVTAEAGRPWEIDPSLFGTINGTVSSGIDDRDNAGPFFGQSITVNIGSTTNDSAIPQSVSLKRVSFQARSTGGTLGSDTAYLHVYDDFDVDASGVPNVIGNLIAVSTNAIDLTAVNFLDELIWYFDEDELDKATEYSYILATNTTAATVLDPSNLSVGVGLEVDPSDPYGGGRSFTANGAPAGAGGSGWDVEFEVITADVSPGAQVADLVITGPISGGTAMVLSWTGEDGKPYGVETNSNLIIAGWQILETGLIGNGGTLSVTNTIGPDETFYRVISE